MASRKSAGKTPRRRVSPRPPAGRTPPPPAHVPDPGFPSSPSEFDPAKGLVLDGYPPLPVRSVDGRLLGHAADWRSLTVGDVLVVYEAMREPASVSDRLVSAIASDDLLDGESPSAIDERLGGSYARALAVFWTPGVANALTQAESRDLIMRWLGTQDLIPYPGPDPNRPIPGHSPS